MEIKVDVAPSVWQMFEQLSADIGKDRTTVLSGMIEKAHAEFLAEQKQAEK